VIAVAGGALRTTLLQLTIEPRGTDTNGTCGLSRGVHVTEGSRVTVKNSTIRDPQNAGVFAEGAGSKATVVGTTIRYLHASASYPGFCVGALVYARLGGTVVVRTSTLSGRDLAGVSSPLACTAVNAETGATVVKSTVISNVNTAIQLTAGGVQQVADVVISKGRGTNGHGIFVAGATGGSIQDSSVTGMSGAGIWLLSSTSGFVVASSDARGNNGPDCKDDNPTSNGWTDVRGTDDAPEGLCTP
jgi:hypothetical protein